MSSEEEDESDYEMERLDADSSYTEETHPKEYSMFTYVRGFLQKGQTTEYSDCKLIQQYRTKPVSENIKATTNRCMCLAEMFTGVKKTKVMKKIKDGQGGRKETTTVEISKRGNPMKTFEEVGPVLSEFRKMNWSESSTVTRSEVLSFMMLFTPYKSCNNVDRYKLRWRPGMPAFCTWGLGAIYGHNFEKFMKVSLQSEFKMTRNIGDGGDKFVKNESKASKGGKQECEKQKEQPVDPSHDMLSHRFGVCQPHADLMKAMIEIWTRGGAELLVADNVGGFTCTFIQRHKVVEWHNASKRKAANMKTHTGLKYCSALAKNFLKKAVVVIAIEGWSYHVVAKDESVPRETAAVFAEEEKTHGFVLALKGKRAYKFGSDEDWVLHSFDGFALTVHPSAINDLRTHWTNSYDLDGVEQDVITSGRANMKLVDAKTVVGGVGYHVTVRNEECGEYGLLKLLLMDDFPVLKEAKPKLDEFVNEICVKCHNLVQEVVGDVEIRKYSLLPKHDFGYMMTRMDQRFVKFEMYHLDFPESVFKKAAEINGYIFTLYLPLTEEGMWVHVLQNHPDIDEQGNPVWDDKEDIYVMGATTDRVEGRGAVRKRNKIEGRWVFVPFGSSLLLPATLYHSVKIRSAVNGNLCSFFHVYVVPEEKEKEFFLQDALKGRVRTEDRRKIASTEGARKRYLVPSLTEKEVLAGRIHEKKQSEHPDYGVGWLLALWEKHLKDNAPPPAEEEEDDNSPSSKKAVSKKKKAGKKKKEDNAPPPAEDEEDDNSPSNVEAASKKKKAGKKKKDSDKKKDADKEKGGDGDEDKTKTKEEPDYTLDETSPEYKRQEEIARGHGMTLLERAELVTRMYLKTNDVAGHENFKYLLESQRGFAEFLSF